jgi:hypothetical protein
MGGGFMKADEYYMKQLDARVSKLEDGLTGYFEYDLRYRGKRKRMEPESVEVRARSESEAVRVSREWCEGKGYKYVSCRKKEVLTADSVKGGERKVG